MIIASLICVDVRKLMKSKAMQEIALEEVYPGENVTADEDLEEYWKTAIRSEHRAYRSVYKRYAI